MSIYASWLVIDDDGHEPACAVYELIGPVPKGWPDDASLMTFGEGEERIAYRRVDKPCTCGNRPPLIYQGSHVNPANDHPRGGSVDIAAIPNFLHPDMRGTGAEDGPPVEFLRLSVDQHETTYGGDQRGSATVVLDRSQVEKIHATLTAWLDAKERH